MSDEAPIERRLARLYSLVRIASAYISIMLNEKCGSCRIVAVFGPYSDNSRAIIDELSRFIAEQGFCSVTLDGLYHPSLPNNQQSINSLIPPLVRSIFQPIQSMYLRILPRVACRVVTNVTDIRSNLIEWDESFLLGKPLFTFRLAELLSIGDERDCEYLYIDNAGWVECKAPSSEFCTRRRFCPFDDLPWIIRQGTMDNRPRCQLIGAKTTNEIKIALDIFIKTPTNQLQDTGI